MCVFLFHKILVIIFTFASALTCQDHRHESVAIRKIKESMLEEAKRFEKTDSGTPEHQTDFYMQ